MSRLVAAVVFSILLAECVMATEYAWLLGGPVTAPVSAQGASTPQGHTPWGVVGASGDPIAWDIVAANYVRGSYGPIYADYTPIVGTRSALWYAQLNSTMEGRYALRCEIARAGNSTEIISEKPVRSPYPSAAAGCIKLPPQPATVAIPALQRESGYYGETPLAIAANDGMTVSGGRVVVCTLTDPSYCTICPAS